jgi:hypothetical protein
MGRALRSVALYGDIIERLERGDKWDVIISELSVSRSQISRARAWNRSVDGPDVDRARGWGDLLS